MKKAPKNKQDPLIGSWVNGDEYATEVEYIITGSAPRYRVEVVDRYDGERGEVRDIAYDSDSATLSFTVYWNSTGRRVKTRLIAISPNRISYTYTFTESEMWFRKGTEPGSARNGRQPGRTATTRKRQAAD
jgi:hypothetical protein